MILEFPDIRDTRCGMELIEEGREEGEIIGLRKSVLQVARKRFGALSSSVEAKIQRLDRKRAVKLVGDLLDMKAMGDLKKWLEKKSPKE
jgi:hypothetical protein